MIYCYPAKAKLEKYFIQLRIISCVRGISKYTEII